MTLCVDEAGMVFAGTQKRSFTAGLQRSLSSGMMCRSDAGRRGFGRARSASTDGECQRYCRCVFLAPQLHFGTNSSCTDHKMFHV